MPPSSAATAPIQQQLLGRKAKHAMVGSIYETVAAPADPGSFGRKMLEKLGWKEGEGLGKNKTGMKDHIRVTQRKEGVGLGADAPAPSEWALPPKPPPAAKKRAAKSDSDDSDSDEDEAEAAVRQNMASSGSGVVPGMSDEQLFQICGGARLGMRARSGQDGKLKRMEEEE